MNIGMLWFDNDPKATLDVKVRRAADYYQSKYGRAPDTCFVHPAMLPDATIQRIVVSGAVEVKASKQMLINHLWVGCNETVAVGISSPVSATLENKHEND